MFRFAVLLAVSLLLSATFSAESYAIAEYKLATKCAMFGVCSSRSYYELQEKALVHCGGLMSERQILSKCYQRHKDNGQNSAKACKGLEPELSFYLKWAEKYNPLDKSMCD